MSPLQEVKWFVWNVSHIFLRETKLGVNNSLEHTKRRQTSTRAWPNQTNKKEKTACQLAIGLCSTILTMGPSPAGRTASDKQLTSWTSPHSNPQATAYLDPQPYLRVSRFDTAVTLGHLPGLLRWRDREPTTDYLSASKKDLKKQTVQLSCPSNGACMRTGWHVHGHCACVEPHPL